MPEEKKVRFLMRARALRQNREDFARIRVVREDLQKLFPRAQPQVASITDIIEEESDHKPLVYIKSAKHINSRVLRWSLILMEYDFSVEYIKGSENVGADYMSRLPST
nr:uncharacterized protein LOC129385946 [Dermacentor andersoni]